LSIEAHRGHSDVPACTPDQPSGASSFHIQAGPPIAGWLAGTEHYLLTPIPRFFVVPRRGWRETPTRCDCLPSVNHCDASAPTGPSCSGCTELPLSG
jgi:hypothetical protein